ncbi:hypothetical protein V6Z12_D08G155000 [Gossypium hirsutum]|uniref:GAG-pre-integrase domain-containing protein n=1 Tax=Gossypium hirsutum TaxID=3635 RepID=A0A1U8JLU6_GOSHI|nr:uncharacterized protein LOC107907000 [Gossypium hirsutum]
MWDAVKENYSDLGNASQVFEIKLKLKDIRQGTLEVTYYYNNLKILWQELDMYYEADWGKGLEHNRFMVHLNNEHLYEFLAGLNRELDEVRGRILGRSPLPTIGEAFAEVRREEKRRLVMMGDSKKPKPMTPISNRLTEISGLISKGPQPQKQRARNDSGSTSPWCSHCNRVGDTKEKCFKLHGYPEKKQKDNKTSMLSSTTADDVLDVRLTKTQLETLHKILGTPTTHGSLATQGDSTLFHTYTPCHNKSRICIADGSYSPVAGIGEEQKSGRMIGTAKVDDGLYIWNKNSTQGGLALSTAKEDTIMLWHRRLGHPNFVYLKNIFRCYFEIKVLIP